MKKSELRDWVDQLPRDLAFLGLFTGDRIFYVDEAVGVEEDGHIVAVVTIAPTGESWSGVPTILALYTLKAYRQKGYGEIAFNAAIARCRERGFARVKVDVLSSHVMKMIRSLSRKDQKYLIVNDGGNVLD